MKWIVPAFLAAILYACVPPTPIPDYSTPTSAPISCHLRGTLPDNQCTPGSLNPAVNADNFHEVICIGGTGQFRPPVAKTNAWKEEIARLYGIANFDPAQYEGDHRVPLALGGFPGSDTDFSNFWDEPRSGNLNAADKDRVELMLYREVCAGQRSLADAQAYFLTDNWVNLIGVARTNLAGAIVTDGDDQ